MKPSLLGFINEKVAEVPDEEWSFKQLYVNNTRLFEYDTTDKKKRWAENAADRKKCLVLNVRKELKETC